MVNVFSHFTNTITKTGGSLITDFRQFREYANIGLTIANKKGVGVLQRLPHKKVRVHHLTILGIFH